jgi:hypothetical protein
MPTKATATTTGDASAAPLRLMRSAPDVAGPAPAFGNSAFPPSPNTSKRGFIPVLTPSFTPGLIVPPEPSISAMYCFPSPTNVIGGPIPLCIPVEPKVGATRALSPAFP